MFAARDAVDVGDAPRKRRGGGLARCNGPWRRVVRLACLTACIASGGPARAQEADLDGQKIVCREAYANAQLHRQRGELLAARNDLRTCGSETCPAIVQTDCVPWLSEVEASIPTLVLEARADGDAIFEVRVKLDGEPVAERLDGRPIPLDPGTHTLIFDTKGRPTLEQHIIVRAGEKNRLLLAEWVSPPQPANRGAVERPVPLGVYLTAAVAAAGFVDFGVAAALGNSAKSEFEAQRCAPFCNHTDVNAMRTRYLIADVGLAVGAAELVTSLVLFATRPALPSRTHTGSRASLPHAAFFASGTAEEAIVGLRATF
jgi:hypothetical protein